jgi:uncharacterized SAM-binding protein YcdF (DUF218 family)
VKADEPVHADAVILLMGSIADRLLQVDDLFEQGLADNLLIVREGSVAYRQLEERGAHFTGNTEQVRNAAVDLGIPADNITILPGDALSTLSEAIIVRKHLIVNPDIDTVILATSASHSRRASMIFETAFRKKNMPVVMLTKPSDYSDFNPSRWWRRKEDIQKVLGEYVRIASFILDEKKWLK